MLIIAIDPGEHDHAVALMSPMTIQKIGYLNTEELVGFIRYKHTEGYKAVIIEKVVSYGMPIGASTIETIFNTGRIYQAALNVNKYILDLIPRKQVCKLVCNNGRAQDKNIRQAVIDYFPATGGGKRPTIGTKKKPGPLYGVSGYDMFSAIALGLAYYEKIKIINL